MNNRLMLRRISQAVSNPYSLVAYWSYDNDFTDQINGNNGIPDPTANRSPNGIVNDCYESSSGNNGLRVVDNPVFQFGDGVNDRPFSLSTWINLDNLSTQFLIAKRRTVTVGEYQLVYSAGSNGIAWFQYSQDNSGNQLATRSNVSINAGSWYHIAVTYNGNGSQPKLFVNNVENTFTDNSGTYIAMSAGGNDLYLSKYESNSFPLLGRQDETVFADVEWTSQQISEIYNYGLNGQSIPF